MHYLYFVNGDCFTIMLFCGKIQQNKVLEIEEKMLGYIYDKKYECLSRSEIENLQSERLTKLVKYVYDNVASYRIKMDAKKLKPTDIKSIKDLYKLPFTTKDDLRDNYPFGLFAVPQNKINRIHASSGTTGKLTVVGYTKNDIEIWSTLMARSLAMAGVTKDDTVHISYGYGLFTGGLGAHYGAEKLGAAVVPVSSGNTKRQIMLLQDFKATTLCCTPSYAAFIADELKAQNIKLSELNLKSGVFGAEPWSYKMRDELEKKLNICALDVYGLSEIMGPGVSMECEIKNGSHIYEDHFIAEIIDENTLEPKGQNVQGEIVFTTLTKEGLPLIRYRTKDISSLTCEQCKCGRTTVRMSKVVGRTDDMLIIRGVNVFPSQIETVLLNTQNIEPHYQIIVERIGNLDTITIEIEISDNLFSDTVGKIESTKRKIAAELDSVLGISADIVFVGPNTIPRSEGKAKRVIDKRKL